jgi:ribosomal protein S18 acetylase RimI-like enzyme
VTDVELHVWEFNQAALAFYETLGYATLERRMGRSLED